MRSCRPRSAGPTSTWTTVRRHTYRVGQRLDDDLGPERPFFVEGCPADWEELPRPDLPLTVSLDGGYRALGPATLPPRRLVRGHRRQERARRRPGQMFRVRPDPRHQAQAGPLRAARRPGHAGQPAGHLPHRRRRRRARPPALPQPTSRTPAGLVPRHDAPHRADPARQGPARTPTGGVRRQRRRPAGTAQVALGPPLTAGWLRRPAFVRKRARARTKAHRFLIPRSGGCLPKRDVARPAGSRLLGFSLEGRLPRLGRTARRTRNRLRGYSADRTTADQRLARDAPLAGGPGSAGYRRLRAALA